MTDKDDPHIAAVKAATKQFDKARHAVEQAIFAAYRAPGVKRTEIAEASPWTAAHVRKLVREEGIGPDPAYRDRAEAIRKRAGGAPPETAAVTQAQPAWLTEWPEIAALTRSQARDRVAQLEAQRPDWFAKNRRDCLAEPPWVDYAMLAADANDPAPPAE